MVRVEECLVGMAYQVQCQGHTQVPAMQCQGAMVRYLGQELE